MHFYNLGVTEMMQGKGGTNPKSANTQQAYFTPISLYRPLIYSSFPNRRVSAGLVSLSSCLSPLGCWIGCMGGKGPDPSLANRRLMVEGL